MSDLGDRILALRGEGKTYNEIVSALGCSKGTVAYYCGASVSENTAKRQKAKRSKWRQYVRDAKIGIPCTDCGEHYPHYVMDYDHLPEFEKKFGISQYNSMASLEELKVEITKCELVCANCHRVRTHARSVEPM